MCVYWRHWKVIENFELGASIFWAGFLRPLFEEIGPRKFRQKSGDAKEAIFITFQRNQYSLIRFLTLLLLSLALMSFSKQGDEKTSVDELITACEKQLKIQKELKELMTLLKTQQEVFFQGNQTKEHASEMVTTAARLLNLIDTHNYRYLFSLSYLQELEMFASIAHKNSPARP